jgi:hypothetical protein
MIEKRCDFHQEVNMLGSDRTSNDDNTAKCQAEWPAMGIGLQVPRPLGNAERRSFELQSSELPLPRRSAKLTTPPVDRWVAEQMFEEDVRTVLQMMRPHGRERLMGWSEHRTGGGDFRVTVSWDEETFADGRASSPGMEVPEGMLSVPRMAEVIAALLIGSVRADADVSADSECDAYLAVLGEVARRVEDLRKQFA